MFVCHIPLTATGGAVRVKENGNDGNARLAFVLDFD